MTTKKRERVMEKLNQEFFNTIGWWVALANASFIEIVKEHPVGNSNNNGKEGEKKKE
jgi:hypothetical protein